MSKPWITDEYRMYLKSERWAAFRKKALEHYGNRCCNRQDEEPVRYTAEGLPACRAHIHPLEVHHLHYDTLYCETLRDVLVLCKLCHEREHEYIDTKRQRNRDTRRYNSALYTYAAKKYGDHVDPWDHIDEFDRWLSRKSIY